MNRATPSDILDAVHRNISPRLNAETEAAAEAFDTAWQATLANLTHRYGLPADAVRRTGKGPDREYSGLIETEIEVAGMRLMTWIGYDRVGDKTVAGEPGVFVTLERRRLTGTRDRIEPREFVALLERRARFRRR